MQPRQIESRSPIHRHPAWTKLAVLAAALCGTGGAAHAAPISFKFPARAGRFQIVAAPLPSAGQAMAAAKLVEAHDRRLILPGPIRTSGNAPQTLDDLIVLADNGEKPYEQTFGAGPLTIDSGTFPDESVYDFNADATFPGALVQGKAAFIDAGQLVVDPLPPAAGTLTLHGVTLKPGASLSTHVGADNAAQVTQAVNELVTQAFYPDQAPVWSCTFASVNSSKDASYAASASFGYGNMVSLSDTFSSADSQSTNHVLAKCTLSFFSISYMPDNRPDAVGNAAFFDPGLTVAQATQYIGPGNPPLFLQSVTYGAEIILLADSNTSSSQMQDSLKAAFSYAGATGSLGLDASTKSTLSTMTVHILAMGGRASAQGPLVTSLTGASVADGLVQYLKEALNIAASSTQSQETAVALSYKLAYLDFTPVAETATILGYTKQVTSANLTGATIQFQQDGNGKGKDTLVDISVEDGSGRSIAYAQVGKNTQWGNNVLSPVIPLPIVAQGAEAALASGNLHLTIHPSGQDRWKFTAYVHFAYDDHTTAFGQFSDELSSDKTVSVAVPDASQPTGTRQEKHAGRDLTKPLADFVH